MRVKAGAGGARQRAGHRAPDALLVAARRQRPEILSVAVDWVSAPPPISGLQNEFPATRQAAATPQPGSRHPKPALMKVLSRVCLRLLLHQPEAGHERRPDPGVDGPSPA